MKLKTQNETETQEARRYKSRETGKGEEEKNKETQNWKHNKKLKQGKE